MSDIFREVDEEVRQDRALAFWTRYQGWLLALAAIVVLATAGWRIWESRQQAFADATSARYTAALEASRAGRHDEAIAVLDEITRTGPRGYRQLAALRAADEYLIVDPVRALKGFDILAANASLDPIFRDAARLRAAMLQLDSGEARDAQMRLLPLAGGGSPFRSTARELLATAALVGDDLEAAARWLDEIVRDPVAPRDVRQRADAFLALVRAGRKPTG